jgi:hypothetical protein
MYSDKFKILIKCCAWGIAAVLMTIFAALSVEIVMAEVQFQASPASQNESIGFDIVRMIKIAWGNPTAVTAGVAIFILAVLLAARRNQPLP